MSIHKPLKVLCLDIEGGHGGSSRSLFNLLKYVDRSRIDPRVVCRRSGIVEHWYAGLGIPCRVWHDMPKVSSLPKLSRNLLVFSQAALDFLRARVSSDVFFAEADGVDVVHFNHEALFLLAFRLARRSRVARTMHIRTNLWNSAFARWQTRVISRSCHRLAFITENEEQTHRGLGGTASGEVIFNAAETPDPPPVPDPSVVALGGFRLACLSNYGWNRGVDRLVEIALVLRRMRRDDIRFVVAGDMTLTRSLPGKLGEIARKGGTLKDYAQFMGVGDAFLFLGHVSNPESVLIACHALIKPTREHNPWGRDILEALAMGRPVISIGKYEMFVEHDRTGLLYSEYNAEDFAAGITCLADNPERLSEMGKEGSMRVATLCHGPSRAADLAGFWERAYRMTSETRAPLMAFDG